MVKFVKTAQYSDWYESQTDKIQAQIDGRLLKIQEHGHYGHVKRLSSVLSEIKFNNGNRIYYTEVVVDGQTMILILGGNKNGQGKDIKRAQKIAEKIHGD
ncbi:MAG: hypothetical protein HC883_02940 [Bdellovibrionaceae bacterium]|nr:hypothetical protein [Pseudobdellovibrionaceae bacterium]